MQLPEIMVVDTFETLDIAYSEWKESIPLTENQQGQRKKTKDIGTDTNDSTDHQITLTAIMQRVLSFPIESKSPIESMTFLADIKQRLAALI